MHSRVSGVSPPPPPPLGAVDRALAVQPYPAALPRSKNESLECAFSPPEAEVACGGFGMSALAGGPGVSLLQFAKTAGLRDW